jgi:hypothetical protein
MKTWLVMIVGSVALLATGILMAQGTKAPLSHTHATGAQSGPSTGMNGPMSQMDEHTKTMQALHDRMISATTPEERQKIMDEQRKEMHAGMAMMNEMQGGAMMGGMGTAMMGQKGKPADANAQMQMMQKRMDMMQMMMQSMMDQQGMMSGPKGPDAAPKK